MVQLAGKIPLWIISIFNFIKKKIIHFRFIKRKRKEFFLIRYIIKELLIYFLVMFLFYFLIFFVNQILVLMLKLLGKNLPFWDVVLLIYYSLPSILSQTAPFATLTGFLMCLGRMNTDNEILILRASGQNPRLIILVPVLALGLLISGFSFFINDYLFPAGMIKYREQYLISISRNPFVEIDSNSVKKLRENTIVTGEVSKNGISDVVFFDKDENYNTRIIVAGNSSIDSAEETGVSMHLNMNDPVVAVLDNQNSKKFELIKAKKMTLNIFESAFIDSGYGIDPGEMTTYDLRQQIKKMKADENTVPQDLNRYILEYNRKYSFSFGALFFAFLALPLALIFGKQNGVFAGFIIGVVISVLYWSLIWIFIIFGSRTGMNGFIAMWIPNFVVGIAGFAFYSIMMRQ